MMPGSTGIAYAMTRNLRPGKAAAGVNAPKPKYGAELFEGTAYPRRWENYVGQDRAKAQLRAAIASAQMQGRRLDHILISSPVAGIGKTALALLTASTRDVGVLEVSGKMDVKQLGMALRQMADGDILFVDEIHRLADGGKKNAEPFLHILQDGVLMTPTGPVTIPNVTVIGATTDKQKLDATIIGRFPVQVQLVEYTEDEAVIIARQHAERVGFGHEMLPLLEGEWLNEVARAGNCNPRLMVGVLTSLRDHALSCYPELPRNERSGYDLTTALAWCGLTPDGLDETAQAYLMLLAGAFGGTAGEKAVAAALGEKAGVQHTEQVLLHKGLILLTPRGRSLTEAGWDRAAQLSPEYEESA
jgi:Holliday junction DNA helicase RuvB